jgi:hypothetical protein
MDDTPYAEEISETTTTLPDKAERILIEEPALANNKLVISSNRKLFVTGKTCRTD